MTYTAGRDHRFHYATDAIEHIEEHNCSKGCALVSPQDALEFGPGGSCELLAMIATEIPIKEMTDDGQIITCHQREPVI